MPYHSGMDTRVRGFSGWWFAVLAFLAAIPAFGAGDDRGIAVPVVAEWLIGGWTGDRWVGAEEIASAATDGLGYGIYGFDSRIGTGVGSAAIPVEGPGEYFDVPISGMPEEPVDSLDEASGGHALAVGAGWNALPRLPKRQSGGFEPYEREVGRILKENGMPSAKAVIRRIVRADLDGDGTEEVIVCAGTADARIPQFRKNTYSMVLFRCLVRGKVETTVIHQEYFRKDVEGEANSPSAWDIPFVLDLNGDGIMEVILSGRYYEGAWYEIHEFRDGVLKRVVTEGVGA